MCRLIIADDHLMFREGIKGLLADQADFEIVAEAADCSEVIASVIAHPADVLITDFTMPGRDGIEMIAHVRALRSSLRILVLTMHHEPQIAARALRAGANGYITKDSAAEQLVEAIRVLATGGQYIFPAIAQQLALAYSLHDSDEHPHTRLSTREYKVFELLLAGRSGMEIAEELSLSAKTVSTHKVRLFRKMNLQNHADLVRYAIQHNLLQTA